MCASEAEPFITFDWNIKVDGGWFPSTDLFIFLIFFSYCIRKHFWERLWLIFWVHFLSLEGKI